MGIVVKDERGVTEGGASSGQSSAHATPSPGAMAAARYVCAMRCQFADAWEPSWSQTRWIATLFDSLGIINVLEAHGTFMRILGAVTRGRVFSDIGEYELRSAANLDLASKNAEYDLRGNRTASFYIRATIDTVSLWSAVASGGLSLAAMRPSGPIAPSIRRAAASGHMGTPVDPREALIQRLLVGRGGHVSPWSTTARHTDRAFGEAMARAVDDLTDFLGGPASRRATPSYGEFQKRAAEHVRQASSSSARVDITSGSTFGAVRTDIAMTTLDSKHARLAARRSAQGEVPVPTTAGASVDGPNMTQLWSAGKGSPHSHWYHPEPNEASFAAIREAFEKALTARNEAVALDWTVRFYYRVARTMPLERGSAAAADAMMRAVARRNSMTLGAWRPGIAADRRAMTLGEDAFVREFPHYFAINNPPGLFP